MLTHTIDRRLSTPKHRTSFVNLHSSNAPSDLSLPSLTHLPTRTRSDQCLDDTDIQMAPKQPKQLAYSIIISSIPHMFASPADQLSSCGKPRQQRPGSSSASGLTRTYLPTQIPIFLPASNSSTRSPPSPFLFFYFIQTSNKTTSMD